MEESVIEGAVCLYARSLSFDIGAADEKLNLCRYGLSNNIVLWGALVRANAVVM
jgi:hypothetical protein